MQVTHPEVTAEHVLGSASAIIYAFVCFLTSAMVDLARDTCGTVLPSLCGSRAQRLLALGQEGWVGGGSGGGGAEEDDPYGVVAGVGGSGEARADDGHELDRFFFL